MGVLIWGRGNKDLKETQNEANNLHKIFHIVYFKSVGTVNRIVKNVHFVNYMVKIYHTEFPKSCKNRVK